MITVTSKGIVNGLIDDKYGKFSQDQIDDVPVCSLPLEWTNVPQGVKSIVVVMLDHDAVPVCGFSWIHWLAADVDPLKRGLEENASRKDQTLIQGKNSLASKQICGDMSDNLTCFYSGPRPPDRDHEYEIKVYALDTKLGLKNGFKYSELVKAMRGHVIDDGILYGTYRAQ